MNHEVIDMHVHLIGETYERDMESLRRMEQRYNLAWLGVIPLWGGLYPTESDIRDGNAIAARFCREQSDRRKLFTTVNPQHGLFAVDEIKRGIEEDGTVAVKIWVSTRADDPAMFLVAEACITAEVPLLLHAWHKSIGQLPHETDAQHVAMLARRYPELKIIMAHLAGAHLWGCAHIANCSNVWSDISGTYCESGTLEAAVALLGEDRVLFGSDAPGADFLNNLAKVEEADLTDAQRRKILHDNATTLFTKS